MIFLFFNLSFVFFKIFFFFISSSLLFSFLRFSPSLVSFSSFLFLFLFLFFFFSFLFCPSSSLSSSLSISFTAHTETRSTRQVTPPTKNGHAPRDPLNQERAINLSILAMSQPGKFSRVESKIKPQAPLAALHMPLTLSATSVATPSLTIVEQTIHQKCC